MTHPLRGRTLAGTATASVLLALPALVGLGTSAAASGATATCTPGKVRFEATAKSKIVVTHGAKFRVPKNTERTFDDPLPVLKRVKADAVGSDYDADVLRAAQKAVRKAPAGSASTLVAFGTRTRGSAIDDEPTTFEKRSTTAHLAIWHGYRVWSGEWSRTACSASGNPDGAVGGTWKSFQKVPSYSGASDCDNQDRKVDERACDLVYG